MMRTYSRISKDTLHRAALTQVARESCKSKWRCLPAGTEHQSSATSSCYSLMGIRLHDLPEDTLLIIFDYVQPEALLHLSYMSTFWNQFCINKVWPRRIASTIGVRALHLRGSEPNSSAWFRLHNTFVSCPSAANLCVCVQLTPNDTVTSLALQFAVSPHDILRTNSLFTEHQLASRTHLYIPLLSESSVTKYTGIPTSGHAPVLVRETALSKKCFLVVQFISAPTASAPSTETKPHLKTYVRQLVVKLIAKGLSVHEDEVRFYLEDNNFDVPKAYKQMLADHQFTG